MPKWVRFEHAGHIGFGTLEGDFVRVHVGDMFAANRITDEVVKLMDIKLLTPTEPSKMIALWNNYHALATKLGLEIPKEPLYLMKAPSSFLAHGGVISRPENYTGKIVFEGELGIVIGHVCHNVNAAQAAQHIFGYTCVNDVTAAELINKDPMFAQWHRAKSFDSFGVFGPVVATGLDPLQLVVRTVLNGEERQNYPVSDIIFSPASLVSEISRCMTLLPGDIIACGTSIGVGALQPDSIVEVTIDGIGTLRNSFQ